jgi:hypothetical protein
MATAARLVGSDAEDCFAIADRPAVPEIVEAETPELSREVGVRRVYLVAAACSGTLLGVMTVVAAHVTGGAVGQSVTLRLDRLRAGQVAFVELANRGVSEWWPLRPANGALVIGLDAGQTVALLDTELQTLTIIDPWSGLPAADRAEQPSLADLGDRDAAEVPVLDMRWGGRAPVIVESSQRDPLAAHRL